MIGYDTDTLEERLRIDLGKGLTESGWVVADELWLLVQRCPARPKCPGRGTEVRVGSGGWPNMRLVITFRHARRPGLLLRRTLELFDEAGGPVSHTYADIHLMEDLDTGGIPPAEEAVDGVLDV